MSRRNAHEGRWNDTASTQQEHIDRNPDHDTAGRPYDTSDWWGELQHEMAQLSRLALEPAVVADGFPRGHRDEAPPAPNLQSGLGLSSSRGRTAGSQDVDGPVLPDRAA